MRRIYLVRHGLPEKSTSEKEYIGVTDLPLSMRGSAEARQLGSYFLQRMQTVNAVGRTDCTFAREQIRQDISNVETRAVVGQQVKLNRSAPSVRILTSPLQRCRQTAEEMYRVLSDGGIALTEPLVIEDLHEIDLGEWEGKSVREIRERFPDAYEARGHALGTYRTPGGESFLEAGLRFQKAIEAYWPDMDESESLLVVAHAGVIRAYLSLLMERDLDHLMDIPLPYASVTELQLSRKGIDVVPDYIGVRPEELLDASEISRMYQKYQTPKPVIRHMRKVAEVADRLMDDMSMPGLNRMRVMKACLLHDLCRAEKEHARVSAEAIRKEGYPVIAALVAVHHQVAYSEREAQGPLTEAEILFYADKRVQEDALVSVEERFRESRKKCRSPEACVKHDAMLAKTLKIEKKIIKNRR